MRNGGSGHTFRQTSVPPPAWLDEADLDSQAFAAPDICDSFQMPTTLKSLVLPTTRLTPLSPSNFPRWIPSEYRSFWLKSRPSGQAGGSLPSGGGS